MNGINPLNAYTQIGLGPQIASQASNHSEKTSPSDTQGIKLSGHQQKFIQGSEGRQEALSKVFDDKTLKRMGVIECSTCASRTYVDGSNDPSVSFKTPTHISPGQSVQAVTGHEMEHVGNEKAAAASDGGEVVSQSVSIHMSTCPECGTSYAAGGTTRTTVRTPVNNEASNATGNLVDLKL